MNARWTEDTEEMVALAIHVADCEESWEECRTWKAHGRAIREVLTGLADAGLLVPPGGEVRDDWDVLYVNAHGVDRPRKYVGRTEDYIRTELDAARSFGMVADRIEQRRVTTWVDGSQLFGPWVEGTTGSPE